jgi:AAA domain
MATAQQANSQSRIVPLKIGEFGGQGSGKSTTAALVAAALSKEVHSGAPVWVTDTEPAWQFIKPRIFLPEKIELVQRKIPTFQAMLHDIRDAERAGACVYIVDQLTTMWQEIMQSFKAKNGGYIPINVWGDVRQTWNEYVIAFRNSPMHCIAIGRLGNVMDEIQDEDKPGKTTLVKTGTTFKAGGSESFGYEPDLLFELSLERKARVRAGSKMEGEGRMIHRADVLKDRTWALNGRIFRWGDKPRYEPGGYRAVWADLKPHFDYVQQTVEQVKLEEGSSVEVIGEDGRGEYYRQQRLKQSCLEDWDATMELLFPGSAALMKRNRAIVGETITGVRSRTKFEQFRVSELEHCVKVLFALEKRMKTDTPSDERALTNCIAMAVKDVDNPEHTKVTLLEAMLGESVAQRRGPQAVVAVVDKPEAAEAF